MVRCAAEDGWTHLADGADVLEISAGQTLCRNVWREPLAD